MLKLAIREPRLREGYGKILKNATLERESSKVVSWPSTATKEDIAFGTENCYSEMCPLEEEGQTASDRNNRRRSGLPQMTISL